MAALEPYANLNKDLFESDKTHAQISFMLSQTVDQKCYEIGVGGFCVKQDLKWKRHVLDTELLFLIGMLSH